MRSTQIKIASRLTPLIPSLITSYGTSFLSFLNILIIARLLGAESFFPVAMGLAIGNFLVPMVNLGTDKAFVRDTITLDQSERRSVARKNLALRALAFSLGLSISAVVSVLISFEHIAEIFVFSAWSSLLGAYPASWFDLIEQTRKQVSLTFIERLINLLTLIVIAYLYKDAGALHIGICFLTSRILFIALQVHAWFKIAGVSNCIPHESTDASYGISMLFSIALLANGFLSYGNQLILGKFSDKSDVSAYSIAFQVVGLIFIFQAQALRFFVRDIAVVQESNLKASISRLSAFILAISFALCVAVAPISYALPRALSDPQYEHVGYYVTLLSIWALITSFGQVVTQHLVSLRMEKLHFRTALLGAPAALVGGLIFIPQHGPVGAILVTIFVHSSMILTNYLKLTKTPILKPANRCA